MRCSRCGEECKENQVFCIKCGSPIHVVPDFDLIQAELANSVGELMSDTSEFTEKNESESFTQNYIPSSARDKELDLINITKKSELEKTRKTEPSETQPKKDKKLLIGLIITGAVVLIIAIAILAMVFFSGEKAGDFDTRYDQGIEFFDSGDYENAITELLVAEKLAETDAEKIKVKEAIVLIYEGMEGKTDEIMSVLIELIELSPEETSYYEKMINIHQADGNDSAIQILINNAPEVVYNEIKVFGVSAPEISPESGDFEEVVRVEISAENATEIYYTIDGTEPDKNSNKYTEAVELLEDGIVEFKAIAYSEKGYGSRVATNTFNIEITTLPAPAVTPVAGAYSSVSQIKVEVPEGYKAYYTYSVSGSTPTTSSTEYTGPIDMVVGNNIFSVIVVNSSGKISEVTSMVYKLTITTP